MSCGKKKHSLPQKKTMLRASTSSCTIHRRDQYGRESRSRTACSAGPISGRLTEPEGKSSSKGTGTGPPQSFMISDNRFARIVDHSSSSAEGDVQMAPERATASSFCSSPEAAGASSCDMRRLKLGGGSMIEETARLLF